MSVILKVAILKSIINRSILFAVISVLFVFGQNSLAQKTAQKPTCDLVFLKKERRAILQQYLDLEENYSKQKAIELKTKVEEYLVEMGVQLKNFNLETFKSEQLFDASAAGILLKKQHQKANRLLEKVFQERKLTSRANLLSDFRALGLSEAQSTEVYLKIKSAFHIWRSRIIIDEIGDAHYNRLAKLLVEKLHLGETSMQVDLLAKNQWVAFFEAEKAGGQFNPSLNGLLLGLFTSVEQHETIHAIVEMAAAVGRDSPYHVFIKLTDPSGAIGSVQEAAAKKAALGGYEVDFYRVELYLDELPAHTIEASFTSVQLSKILSEQLSTFLESEVKSQSTRDQVFRLYADYLESPQSLKQTQAGPTARKLFDRFLNSTTSSFGRTGLKKNYDELRGLLSSIWTIQDNSLTALTRAKQRIEQMISESRPLQIQKDVFLSREGYKVVVPIMTRKFDPHSGQFIEIKDGALVNFRFTSQAPFSPDLTPAMSDDLFKELNWGIQLMTDFDQKLRPFKSGQFSRTPTVGEILELKQLQADLRQIMRETYAEIKK